MKIRDFFISWAIATVVFILGRLNGFSTLEIFVMCFLAGIIQGALTGYLRNRGTK